MRYLILCFAFAIISCSSSKPVVAAESKAESSTESNKVILGHQSLDSNFKTLYIKSDARYEDDKQTQNVSAEIRIKRDEMILVSVRFLGITMAKALITPTEVKYYEKLNGNYFEGDYATLSQWLGTELDFAKVQNLLIGRSLDDLSKGRYTMKIEDSLFKLEDNSNRGTQKSYFFEAGNFLLKKSIVQQSQQARSLEVNYPGYSKQETIFLPTAILLEALHAKGKTNIEIEYKSVNLNQDISFPYSVPEGYERINID